MNTAEGSMEGLKRHGARGRAWSCLRIMVPFYGQAIEKALDAE